MNSKKICIPYIYIEKRCSKNAINIMENVKNLLNKNKIPYILNENGRFILCINNSKYLLNSIEEVMYISKVCVVIEAMYTNKSRYIIDKYIDFGFDVLCFPSYISNKYGIFSNNLIRDGAICLTSYYMLLEYLIT